MSSTRRSQRAGELKRKRFDPRVFGMTVRGARGQRSLRHFAKVIGTLQWVFTRAAAETYIRRGWKPVAVRGNGDAWVAWLMKRGE